MSEPHHRFEPAGPHHDLTAFDCGDERYDRWLQTSALAAVRSGTAAVTVLVRDAPSGARVAGYFALAPTGVVRGAVPNSARSGRLDPIPGYLLAKLALDRTYRGDRVNLWGTQLLLGAFRQVLAASATGGGRLLVVDADNEGLVPWYRGHGFLPTGVDPLRLYLKIATIRRYVDDYDSRGEGASG
ncbi:N-acetyltransferase [Nocardioides zeae]|uniref:N-acetyltransferase n=1 Tax=Nocardioides zeae TaxID=1457234 RepID=A0A6P0HEN5_9ACTN|nr:N-acetyltransferase [Nocardioides zeae]NEN77133.1 N-acetyltransferase [Nocardioides zeae]